MKTYYKKDYDKMLKQLRYMRRGLCEKYQVYDCNKDCTLCTDFVQDVDSYYGTCVGDNYHEYVETIIDILINKEKK